MTKAIWICVIRGAKTTRGVFYVPPSDIYTYKNLRLSDRIKISL